MKNTTSYYEILSVSPQASDEDIKRAYHALAKKFHPDRNPQSRRMAELRFRVISEAYTSLKTQDKRASYNQSLKLHAQNDNINNDTGFFAQISQIFWPKKKEIQE